MLIIFIQKLKQKLSKEQLKANHNTMVRIQTAFWLKQKLSKEQLKANHNGLAENPCGSQLKQKLSKEQLKANHNPLLPLSKSGAAETKIVKGTIESKSQLT